MDIRTLQESPDDLSAFVTTTWRNDYGGRMVIPLWTPQYFDWQLRMSSDPDRRQLLGAYHGSRLVGTLLGVSCPLRVDGQPRSSLISSWLTIAPDVRRQGLVGRLKQEQTRRLQEDAGELILSYRYHGTGDSLADRPQRRREDEVGEDVRRVGLWARLLDARRAVDWYLKGADRWLTRLGHPFVGNLKPRTSSITVRDVDDNDLTACVELFRRSAADATLAIDWNTDLLRQHLGGAAGRGLVACRGDEVVGLIGYHLLPYLGGTEELLGVIDLLLIDALGHQERVTFLKLALERMQQAGAILAVKMGLGDLPVVAMLDAGFVPRSRDSLQVLRWLSPQARTKLQGKQLVLWR